eukprot:CAMPEP_0202894926 /NCGR_PEP_ID=MMETSP1392-20130828/4227_1 /ASSEMBLY_ACC=CAM_ASM_000868 /TAXON_ID=225041 /ORGANISM="Chlamydomonas chlamydogama, Strain SAG 11-48b" /LENGTH=166 /DNA_ID=CAMNT_0049579773 /DNA_START=18 /DNA_END=518 /DNA_ORIENTATION=-
MLRWLKGLYAKLLGVAEVEESNLDQEGVTKVEDELSLKGTRTPVAGAPASTSRLRTPITHSQGGSLTSLDESPEALSTPALDSRVESLASSSEQSTALPPTDVKRYIVDGTTTVGVDNTVARYHPSKPVVVHMTPFECRVANAIERERTAAELMNMRQQGLTQGGL